MSTLRDLNVAQLGTILLKEGISSTIVSLLDEQDIDGNTLLFMIEDISEFKEVLPKAGDRLAIKMFIRKCEKAIDCSKEKQTRVDMNMFQSHIPASYKKVILHECMVSVCNSKFVVDDGNDTTSPTESHIPASYKKVILHECMVSVCDSKFVVDDGNDTTSPTEVLDVSDVTRTEELDDDDDGDSQSENHGGVKRKHQPSSQEGPSPKRKPLQESDTNVPLVPLFNIHKITLPHFGRKTRAAIESGDITLPTARAAFVRECVAHYEPILPRPTEEQYTAIAKALLQHYPSLKDKGTCYWATLKSQIMQRFRNNRRKSTSAKAQKLKGVVLPPLTGKQLPENTSSTNTDEVLQEALEDLRKLFEGKTAAPNGVVQKLLEQTRQHRHDWLNQQVSIDTILKTWPAFKLPKWLLYEFSKVVEEEIKDKVTKNWVSICEKLSGAEGVPSFEEELQTLNKIIKNIYHKTSAQNVVVVTPATGNIDDQFTSTIMEPRLVVFTDDGQLSQMFLCAENQEMMEVPGNTLADGILHLMASYYVLNIDYPKGCKPLLYFFQDILMEKPDVVGPAKNRPTRYKTFINRI